MARTCIESCEHVLLYPQMLDVRTQGHHAIIPPNTHSAPDSVVNSSLERGNVFRVLLHGRLPTPPLRALGYLVTILDHCDCRSYCCCCASSWTVAMNKTAGKRSIPCYDAGVQYRRRWSFPPAIPDSKMTIEDEEEGVCAC